MNLMGCAVTVFEGAFVVHSSRADTGVADRLLYFFNLRVVVEGRGDEGDAQGVGNGTTR